MDIARKLDDGGMDIIKASVYMKMIGVSTDDFLDDAKFHKFNDVFNFFSKYENGDWFINKLLIGKNVDRLDHLWTYQELARQRLSLNEDIKRVEGEILLPHNSDNQKEMLSFQLQQKKMQETDLAEQLDKYES